MVHISTLQDTDCGMWSQCHVVESGKTSVVYSNFPLHTLEWGFTIVWSIQTLISKLPGSSVIDLYEGLLNNFGVFDINFALNLVKKNTSFEAVKSKHLGCCQLSLVCLFLYSSWYLSCKCCYCSLLRSHRTFTHYL